MSSADRAELEQQKEMAKRHHDEQKMRQSMAQMKFKPEPENAMPAQEDIEETKVSAPPMISPNVAAAPSKIKPTESENIPLAQAPSELKKQQTSEIGGDGVQMINTNQSDRQ